MPRTPPPWSITDNKSRKTISTSTQQHVSNSFTLDTIDMSTNTTNNKYKTHLSVQRPHSSSSPSRWSSLDISLMISNDISLGALPWPDNLDQRKPRVSPNHTGLNQNIYYYIAEVNNIHQVYGFYDECLRKYGSITVLDIFYKIPSQRYPFVRMRALIKDRWVSSNCDAGVEVLHRDLRLPLLVRHHRRQDLLCPRWLESLHPDSWPD